jgi:hypothetical protein
LTGRLWIVREGQIRLSLDGQEPFVAGPGYLAQAPYRTFYPMAAVADKPSLRLEVNIGHLARFYRDKAACRPGMNGFQDIGHFFDPKD